MALEPITRQEKIIAGQDLTPITRMEKFLKEFGGSGGSGGGAQPDWNAAEGELGHILNRPFYEDIITLFDQRVEFAEGEYMQSELLPISAGDTVAVTIDGVRYEAVASDRAEIAPGAALVVIPIGDAGLNFMLGTAPSMGTVMHMPTDAITSATVKIEKPVIHTIDPKFLPEMSSYCHVNIWYDSDSGEYKSDKTYEDIKAAEAAKTPVIGTLAVPSGNVYTLVGCDATLPSAYLVAFDLFNLPTTLKVFRASIGENNNVSVLASNFSGTATDV